MSNNFFNFDSTYQYEPVIKQLDEKTVSKDIDAFRRKVLEFINQVTSQQEISKSELSLAARIPPQIAGQILKNNIDKISTDRLLKIARRIGLKPKISFTAEN